MQKTSLILLTVATILVFSNIAQAVTFTVNNASITNVINNAGNDNSNFNWTVAQISNLNSSADLTTIGSSFSFIYGYFSTNDFPIQAPDYTDNVGSFLAGFNLLLPIQGGTVNTGSPDAIGNTPINNGVNTLVENGAVKVLFGNPSPSNSRSFTTADGFGAFDVIFNDLTNITLNGQYALSATIILDSYELYPVEPHIDTPVPEPGTMVLFGFGMLGLAIYGKRRMNNKEI